MITFLLSNQNQEMVPLFIESNLRNSYLYKQTQIKVSLYMMQDFRVAMVQEHKTIKLILSETIMRMIQ